MYQPVDDAWMVVKRLLPWQYVRVFVEARRSLVNTGNGDVVVHRRLDAAGDRVDVLVPCLD